MINESVLEGLVNSRHQRQREVLLGSFHKAKVKSFKYAEKARWGFQLTPEITHHNSGCEMLIWGWQATTLCSAGASWRG